MHNHLQSISTILLGFIMTSNVIHIHVNT